MNPAEAQSVRAQILTLLDQQIDAMEGVLSCLKSECEALEKRDVEQLLQITNRKEISLAAANRIDQLRRKLSESDQAGGEDGRNGEILERQRKLRKLALACREQNDANGSMIRLQSRRVDNTLRLLRGDRGESVVYGSKGEPAQRTQSQKFLTSV